MEDWSLHPPWVWLPPSHYREEDNQPARFFLFRKTFSWQPDDHDQDDQDDQPVLLHVSADSRYRLFVNGHRVSFGPCKSPRGQWHYETVDIRPHLRRGRHRNVLSARVLRYSSLVPGSSSIVSRPRPGFLLVPAVPGRPPVGTDTPWRCCEETTRRIVPRSEWNYLLGPPFLCINERVTEDAALAGWHSPPYDDAAWPAAVPQETAAVQMLPVVSPWRLAPRPIPALPETPGRLDGVIQTHGAVSADQWTALIRADQPVVVPARARVTVDLAVAHLLTAFDLGVDTSPVPRPRSKADRSDPRGGRARLYGPRDFYTVAAGQPAHAFEPFWFRCFRYCQLDIVTADAPLTVSGIALRETSYPLPVTTRLLQATPPDLMRIWAISLRTLQNCRHETYEDCPFYEQNQFAADARLQMRFGYQLSPDDRLARKTLAEFDASRTPDGLIGAQSPSGFPSRQIPLFSLFWILMLHDHLRYHADAALVRRYLGTVDGIVQHFEARLDAARGLVGRFEADTWPFVDWVAAWMVPGHIFASCMPPAYHATGAATVNSLLYAYALRHAADLCDFVGRRSTADEYRARVATLQAAVNAQCRGEASAFYQDGPGVAQYSQHTQVFAILTDTVTGDAARRLLRQTLAAPGLARCSYAMQFYVFRAAEHTGLYAEVFAQLLAPWRAMMAQNLTTWAEDDVNARSDCHGWSASPVNEIVTQLFGVTPLEPGFARVRIAPRRELLEAAEGTLHTPRGDLHLRWAQGEALTVEATREMAVEVVLGATTYPTVLAPGETVCFQ
ncbi:alpha-L-rhamnosidase [Aspergillus heteromorphus CBS 117.55]|uniref:Alpha-L-rhamnosidase n=1 Tax=Aspergillus heteromorphus CBS 117.55 TaxID=1448321 RepID=A0A317VLV8_9EURO|nr:alpha-L-rhamnosidase [Aspergillus heteromorphus CBS 117.55]PWY75354.1 alpha-L-rhamnosidase [Aspergillus heteromorphus CBS 117.55]